jgi:hypothetical protein
MNERVHDFAWTPDVDYPGLRRLYVTMMNFNDEAQGKAKAVEPARQALTNLPR